MNPAEHDATREGCETPDKKSANRRKEFFIEKDKFESLLEGRILSDAEKDLLVKALELGYCAGKETIQSVWNGDPQNADRVYEFYQNVVRRVRTGSYVRHDQIAEGD